MMNKKKILIISGIFLIVGIATEVVLAISSMKSGPSCKGSSCSGLDARDLKCDGSPQTLVDKKAQGITLDLRYSASCDASWARATVPIGTVLYVENVNGQQFGHYIVPADGIPSAHYGNMGAGKALKACAKLPDTKVLCTDLP
jgi:Protein of unknown function (DUF2690)